MGYVPGTEEDPVQKLTSKRGRQCGKHKVIIQKHVQGQGRKTEEEQPHACSGRERHGMRHGMMRAGGEGAGPPVLWKEQ